MVKRTEQNNNPNQDPNQGYTNPAEESSLDYDDDFGFEVKSSATSSEELLKFVENMKNQCKDPGVQQAASIEVVEVYDSELYIPVVTVCAKRPAGEIVAYPMLIEELLTEELRPDTELRTDQSGNTVEIITDRVTSYCFDQTCRRITQNSLAKHFGTSPEKISLLPPSVVFREVDLSVEAAAVARFSSARMALMFSLGLSGQKSFTAHNLTGTKDDGQGGYINLNDNTRVEQRVVLHPGATELTASGLTAASDFQIITELAKGTENNQQKQRRSTEIHGTARRNLLSSVHGFLDFVRVRPTPIQEPNPQPNMPMKYASFLPQIVVTDISGLDTQRKRVVEDIRTIMMGLSSLVPILQDNGFVRILDTSPKEGSSKATVGNLNLHYNPEDPSGTDPKRLGRIPVQFSGATSQPKEDHMLPLEIIRQYCVPGAIVAIDVVSGERNTWAQDVLVVAAGGNCQPNAQVTERQIKANNILCAEADALTRGMFTAKWRTAFGLDTNAVLPLIVQQGAIPIPIAQYKDGDGRIRDARHLDLLALSEKFPKDRAKLAAITRCMYRGQSNADSYSYYRSNIEQIAGPSYEVRAMASRVWLTQKFLPVFISALVEAGVRFQNGRNLGYTHMDHGFYFGNDSAVDLTGHNIMYDGHGHASGYQPTATAAWHNPVFYQ